jgi:hypothetical protein
LLNYGILLDAVKNVLVFNAIGITNPLTKAKKKKSQWMESCHLAWSF